ncbi:N-acetyl-gamma-glutamyl-phosphate reductase [Candidatus Albibeggiatoa sp. nov. NOAA]|uniref:N-acetyl-gamma-glutamyl-phosphate reductase n=1 Tax=Candidatus Albibeggiatoa sp. nov. NOAA TaxID=3162724 RepID=UPI0032F5E902|nr:N-acetyl-gamma-glutamyl-phosphate reductase [Thiotrichaceae bacterium]
MKIKIGIVGGTGYTGVELLRLLAKHPQAQLDIITSRGEAGKHVTELFPNLRGHVDLRFSNPDYDALSACDVVFFATPHATAMYSMAKLIEAGTRVIDLSADFRIKDVKLWEQWYNVEHACPELIDMAVYGLAELNRKQIAQAQLVACPGCYPTAMQLGLLPLIEAGVVDTQDLIVDAKSGVSGAGRKASVAGLMGETGESFKAYAASGHRHLPETIESLSRVAQHQVQLTFVPHLVPMVRGMEATIFANLTQQQKNQSLQDLFEQRYKDEPFVDVLPQGSHPETRSVRGVNTCQLAIHQPKNSSKVIVLSVIDNLVKGASGQAIQNMNIMFDLPETTGLDGVGLLP